MRRVLTVVGLLFILSATLSNAQTAAVRPSLTPSSTIKHTPVKDQANSGTCWSFSTTSLVESQSIKNGLGEFDLSEMFTVRSIYIEKAKNYIRRQGKAQFGAGGLGHDVISSMDVYGAIPESAYSGLPLGVRQHDHSRMDQQLTLFLDSLLKVRPIPTGWMKRFESILNDHMGKPPATFTFREKQYTPKTFADEVLHFKANDYVYLTSFSHHPFYKPFILEVPDNFQNESYFNLPLEELIKLTEKCVASGFSVMWDADVSNNFFMQRSGYAMQLKDSSKVKSGINPDDSEITFDQQMRQMLFENLTTEDDHLMHIVGLTKSAKGKTFFLVKNSWGSVGPFKGMINVSEAYFAINTISLILPKAALDKALLTKLHVN